MLRQYGNHIVAVSFLISIISRLLLPRKCYWFFHHEIYYMCSIHIISHCYCCLYEY